MNDSPRPSPYIWVTWLTGLLAGTDKCKWKPWYKAHFRYAKRPDDGGFDLVAWTKQHDRMVSESVLSLRTSGYQVRVEEENAFKLQGRVGTLAGKPDIVALDQDAKHAKVIDEKSGKQRPSDRWQVLLYMFALPLTWLKGFTVQGEVVYRGSSHLIESTELTTQAQDKILRIINQTGGVKEPKRTPSVRECRFCDILACPERVGESMPKATTTGAF